MSNLHPFHHKADHVIDLRSFHELHQHSNAPHNRDERIHLKGAILGNLLIYYDVR